MKHLPILLAVTLLMACCPPIVKQEFPTPPADLMNRAKNLRSIP